MALVGGAALLAAWRTRSCLGEETRFPSDGEEGSLTFMILSRSSKKRWGLSGFVKVGEVLVAADKGNADDWESVNGVLARSKISGSLLHRLRRPWTAWGQEAPTVII